MPPWTWTRRAALLATAAILLNGSAPAASGGRLDPASAVAERDEHEVRAANVPGSGPLPPGATVLPYVSEPADCTTSQDGTARYFLSLQSTAGTDILNGAGRLV